MTEETRNWYALLVAGVPVLVGWHNSKPLPSDFYGFHHLKNLLPGSSVRVVAVCVKVVDEEAKP